jgi:hypothetical protein
MIERILLVSTIIETWLAINPTKALQPIPTMNVGIRRTTVCSGERPT